MTTGKLRLTLIATVICQRSRVGLWPSNEAGLVLRPD